MKHHLPLLSALLVAGLLLPGFLPAQEKAPTQGKVLILDTERTLEGDIERVGDRYCVKRSIGETWVSAKQVLRLCQSRQDAYKFLASQRNLNDPDERLRLAKWCHLQGLPAEALEECRAAVRLRPGHVESCRILQHLEEGARAAAQTPTTAAPPTPAAPKELPLAVSAESLNLFATRVQPILMNTCVNCHGAERDVKFRLHRVYEVGLSDNGTLHDNLASVLGQLNVGEPQLSPLLVKAVSAHGPTGKAPLTGRQSAAFKSLEDWVKLTVSNQPIVDRAPALAAPLAQAGVTEKAMPPVPDKLTPPDGDPKPKPAFAQPDEQETPKTPKTPESADEFDPGIFNRQMHPQAAPPGAPEKPK